KGRTTATRQVDTDTSEELTTYYSYSPLSELLTVTDAEGFITSYEYDKFGQKVLTDHPDNGKTVFTYNLAGQLVQLANQNLLDLGQYIEYVYSYNQLRKIIYPSHRSEERRVGKECRSRGAPNP